MIDDISPRPAPWWLQILGAVALAAAGWLAGAAAANLQPTRVGAEVRPAVAESKRADTPIPYRPMALAALNQRVIVLTYHDIIAARGRDSLWWDVTTDELRTQLEFIRDNGGHFLSLEEFAAHMVDGAPVPPRSVLLTFDDNYQSFRDLALPLLKEFRAPATLFIHTAFVGNQNGRPKLSWESLRALRNEPLVTFGSHTDRHLSGFRQLPAAQQLRELARSKGILERELEREITWICYPEGSADGQTARLAEQAGYAMGFTTELGFAEESPDTLLINRVMPHRLEEQWARRESLPVYGLGAGRVAWQSTPVEAARTEIDGKLVALVKGGSVVSRLSRGRQSVGEFIREAKGVAGVNGGFFRMAEIKSLDNTMVGPARAGHDGVFRPEQEVAMQARLRNRPFVAWDEKGIVFAPFQPGVMNSARAIAAWMPNMADAFVAGAWLVREGRALTAEEIAIAATSDAGDIRFRACFGVTTDGRPFALATRTAVDSARLAQIAVAAGAAYAVLLDSGFSTSVVADDDVLASGHRTADAASRPVPHALVFRGELVYEPDATMLAARVERERARNKKGE